MLAKVIGFAGSDFAKADASLLCVALGDRKESFLGDKVNKLKVSGFGSIQKKRFRAPEKGGALVHVAVNCL